MWFLDAGRANPQLKVTRYQFPIAPDFADTFYGAQGSTIEPGVIVDMVGADPIAAYIGMTRCRTRQQDLDLPTVPAGAFSRRPSTGTATSSGTCGSRSRWTGMRCAKKYLDERPCQECGEMKRKDAFTKAQWKQEASIGSAKNALRRSVRPARHIDAHSAACGTPQHTLRQSTKTLAGACIASAFHVTQKKMFCLQREPNKGFFLHRRMAHEKT